MERREEEKKKKKNRREGRRKEKRREERYGTFMQCYDFVWKLLGYGFLGLCMVIGLFHF